MGKTLGYGLVADVSVSFWLWSLAVFCLVLVNMIGGSDLLALSITRILVIIICFIAIIIIEAAGV